jgi:hypothetical protein
MQSLLIRFEIVEFSLVHDLSSNLFGLGYFEQLFCSLAHTYFRQDVRVGYRPRKKKHKGKATRNR